MQRLIVVVAFCVFVSSPFISFADNFSVGVKANIIPKNKEAVRIFRISAKEGDRNSQHSLGVMLYKGRGIKQDYGEAFKWLDLAAKQGHSQAKLDLSIMIYHKRGIPKNYIYEYK